MRISSLVLTAAAALLTGTIARADTFSITYGAPTVQFPDSTVVSGATTLGTETFDSIPAGSVGFTTDYGTGGAITGTYSAGADIVPADVFGGANGTGQFVDSIGGTPGYTVTLATNSGTPGVNYFGFWLSALDAGNQLEFLRGGTQVGAFTPADLVAALGTCTGGNPYCGNPTSPFLGGDGGEPFAFVNFVDTNGFFDELAFTENPVVGNYESDNHTVAFCSNPAACISGTVLSGPPPVATPEPASIALLGTALAGVGIFRRRKRAA